MALRTFRSNPALGGFGGESSAPLANVLRLDGQRGTPPTTNSAVDCDAFAQIIKELVDNAVDACSVPVMNATDGDTARASATATASSKRRVRVSIERFEDTASLGGSGNGSSGSSTGGARGDANIMDDDNVAHQDVLRVTVTDNGCGIKDIQASVEAFRTSKAHAAAATDNSMAATNEGQTAGRYGIGLTLCLLHAQRLVPGSCATIKSATATTEHYTFMTCVVDTEGDSVRCIRREQLPKSFASESGTAVSVLVPGGTTAMLAWPRLAEYFARFKLSLGLQCSLEVMAPSLSKIPLIVRPLSQNAQEDSTASQSRGTANQPWLEGLEYNEADTASRSSSQDESNRTVKDSQVDDEQTKIWKAMQLYLGYPLKIKNVAHTLVPIRIGSRRPHDSTPKLEVDLIVQGEDRDGVALDAEEGDVDVASTGAASSGSAAMLLVRMVNRIPLLDSAEAIACGLVQGLAAKKRVWNSFGLDVTLQYDSNNITKLPTFQVRDSDQVAPFFQTGAHALYEGDEDDLEDYDEDGSVIQDEMSLGDRDKRKRKRMRRVLLPAKVRLGNIVVIIQIHAEPTTLPLPTLSKGRLPVDNSDIDAALELGLIECLRQLQKSNPGLLLTATELRKAERDARYVPAVSSALASILCKPSHESQALLDSIHQWSEAKYAAPNEHAEVAVDLRLDHEKIQELGAFIEGRLRLVLSHGGKKEATENDSGDERQKQQDDDMDDVLEQSSEGSDPQSPQRTPADVLLALTEL